MSWLEAYFGRIFSSSVEREITGGLNFTGGLTAVVNSSTNRTDVSIEDESALSPFDHIVFTIDDLPDAVGGYIDLTSGTWAFAADISTINKLRVAAGEVVHLYGFGHAFTNTTSTINGVEVLGELYVENLSISTLGTAPRCVFMNHANAVVRLQQCTLCCDNGYAVEIAAGDRLQVIGGIWGASVTAIGVDGNIDLIQVSGLQDQSTDLFVYHDTGTVRAAHFTNCAAEKGISWPSADIPSDGLLLVGCSFNVAVPWNGFTAASARVNVKACLNSTGLETETAIV